MQEILKEYEESRKQHQPKECGGKQVLRHLTYDEVHLSIDVPECSYCLEEFQPKRDNLGPKWPRFISDLWNSLLIKGYQAMFKCYGFSTSLKRVGSSEKSSDGDCNQRPRDYGNSFHPLVYFKIADEIV